MNNFEERFMNCVPSFIKTISDILNNGIGRVNQIEINSCSNENMRIKLRYATLNKTLTDLAIIATPPIDTYLYGIEVNRSFYKINILVYKTKDQDTIEINLNEYNNLCNTIDISMNVLYIIFSYFHIDTTEISINWREGIVKNVDIGIHSKEFIFPIIYTFDTFTFCIEGNKLTPTGKFNEKEENIHSQC